MIMGRPEGIVEQAHIKKVRSKGGESYKFTSPGLRGVPDRIDLYPIEAGHEEIVSRYVNFTETKAPKKKPDRRQISEHKRLRKMGFTVNVVDRKE
jgi:hypothetical protein